MGLNERNIASALLGYRCLARNYAGVLSKPLVLILLSAVASTGRWSMNDSCNYRLLCSDWQCGMQLQRVTLDLLLNATIRTHAAQIRRA